MLRRHNKLHPDGKFSWFCKTCWDRVAGHWSEEDATRDGKKHVKDHPDHDVRVTKSISVAENKKGAQPWSVEVK